MAMYVTLYIHNNILNTAAVGCSNNKGNCLHRELSSNDENTPRDITSQVVIGVISIKTNIAGPATTTSEALPLLSISM